jgi:hypothetical protein
MWVELVSGKIAVSRGITGKPLDGKKMKGNAFQIELIIGFIGRRVIHALGPYR